MVSSHQWTVCWRLLLLFEVLLVLYLALSPAPPQTVDLGWDKLNHLAAFAIMTMTAGQGFKHACKQVLVALLAFGGLIELLQSFVPNRYAEWGDLGADALGIALGLLVWRILRRLVQRHDPCVQ